MTSYRLHLPKANRHTPHGLRHCHLCGHVYTNHSKWCPRCLDNAGHLKPMQIPKPKPVTPYPAGTPVVVGDVYRNCQSLSGRRGTVIGISPLGTCNLVNVEGIGEMPIYLRHLTPA